MEEKLDGVGAVLSVATPAASVVVVVEVHVVIVVVDDVKVACDHQHEVVLQQLFVQV